MMEGKRFIHSIRLENFLSYGPAGIEMELQPLNVLIGPNASGKSNFLDAIKILKATASDLRVPILQGGGIGGWFWKGGDQEPETPYFRLVADSPYRDASVPLRYDLTVVGINQGFQVYQERILGEGINNQADHMTALYANNYGSHTIRANKSGTRAESLKTILWEEREIKASDLISDQSILSQRTDPDVYPALYYLSQQFGNIQVYAEANLGRLTAVRKPQDVSLRQDHLLEDASNLALVLNDLERRPGGLNVILKYLKLFYEQAGRIITYINGGTVQVYIEEEGLRQTIPASRLSDGTLRYLCLLTILCHPAPPPLVCIEEPELGMHPDIIPVIAELLVEASQRTQLIVTTHSDLLISKLRDIPETILVCDRAKNGTTIKRLDPVDLESWLEDYSLGDAWLKGAFGGTRW